MSQNRKKLQNLHNIYYKLDKPFDLLALINQNREFKLRSDCDTL